MLHGRYITTTFDPILWHKKSIRVTLRLQTIFNAIFVAATDCTTLAGFIYLQHCCNKLIHVSIFCNIITLKVVPCNITCIGTCFLILAAFNQNAHIQNVIL